MRCSAVTAMLCLALVHAAGAADLLGTWKGTITSNEGGKFATTLVLTKDGDAVKGTIASGSGEPKEVSDVKIDGLTVSFKRVVQSGDTTITIVYTGVVKDDVMDLRVGREGATTRVQKGTLTKEKE
jgi:hypothetical protein